MVATSTSTRNIPSSTPLEEGFLVPFSPIRANTALAVIAALMLNSSTLMNRESSQKKHLKKPDSSSFFDTFRGLCSARVLSLMILSGVSSFPQAGYTQEVSKANINPSEIGALSGKPDYEGMLLEAFEGDIEISDSFRIAINTYVKPLHQVLIDKDLGDILTGDDVANVIALTLTPRGDKDFVEQYDFVAASFPNPDLDSAWRAKLAELFLKKKE